jgi:hypothetical protein
MRVPLRFRGEDRSSSLKRLISPDVYRQVMNTCVHTKTFSSVVSNVHTINSHRGGPGPIKAKLLCVPLVWDTHHGSSFCFFQAAAKDPIFSKQQNKRIDQSSI